MSPAEILNKGHDAFQREAFQEALEYYNQAIQVAPDLAAPYFYRGLVNSFLGSFNEAIADFDQTLIRDPENAVAYFNRANAKSIIGAYLEAIIDYDKALTLDPDNAKIYAHRADTKASLGRHNAAIEDYNQAIYLDPDDAIAIGNRGLAKFHKGEVAAAIDDYDIAIMLEPEDAETYGNRGVANIHLGLYETAMDDFDEAIKINPNLAFPWRGKAIVYLNENNPAWAKVYFIRAAYLGSRSFRNALALFREHPIAPFFTLRLIREKVSPLAYGQNAQVIQTSLKQAKEMYHFLIQQSLKSTKAGDDFNWKKWLGIINYYMGDPVAAFHLLNTLAEEGSSDLMLHYYLIMTCFDFAEDEDTYLGRAIAIAEQQKEQEVQNQEAILAHYYAGLIFVLDEEPEDALLCFSKIQHDFLPAAYMALLIQKELENQEAIGPLQSYLIEQEQQLGDKGFSKGLKELKLGLEQDNLFDPLSHHFHYTEIAEAIFCLSELLGEKADFKIEAPYEQKATYELLKFDVAALKDSVSSIDFNAWEARLSKEKAFTTSFERLMQASNKSDFEESLGQEIKSLHLSDTDYNELLNYFYVKGQLSEYQRLLLFFYWLYRKIKQDLPPEVHQNAMKDGIEMILGEGLAILNAVVAGEIIPKHPTLRGTVLRALNAYDLTYSKSTLGWLFFEFYRIQDELADDYPAFKAAFERFVEEEREDIGADKFETRFPIEELK